MSKHDSAPRMADLRAATTAVGQTHAEQLAWMTRFARETPTHWQSGTRAAHGDCLLALAVGGVPENCIDMALPAALDAREIAHLHGMIRTTLHLLVSSAPGAVIQFPTVLQPAMTRATAVGEKPAIFATMDGHRSLPSAVLHRLRELVMREGAHLLACPACGLAFVASGKQMFCSPQCAQQARNDRKARAPR